MGGLDARAVMRGVAAVLSILAVAWLALWYFIPAPPHQLTIAAGVKGGAFDHLSERYRERLASHHVTLSLRFYDVANENVRLVNDPKSGVSAALLFSGQSNGKESPDLLSLGRIDNTPLWIFYRVAAPIDRLTQMKGKRINVSPGVGKLVEEILAVNGVNAGNATMSTLLIPAAVKGLRDGDLDAVFLPPVPVSSPIIQSLLHDSSVGLMNVVQADALTRLFPTLNRLVLPQGVIDMEKNVPATDVNLIGSSNVVVVRKDLHPELIYLLAQTVQEEHSRAGIFNRAGEFPTLTDPEYPMAEEAVDYYRNGPSFLRRYLPFWMINYAKRLAAIIVAAVAIVIPVFTYAPRLYHWLIGARLMKLYRRLRDIETELESQLTTVQVDAVQEKLESIYRAARILPMRHSDLFINLMTHIRLMRMELASRLAAARD